MYKIQLAIVTALLLATSVVRADDDPAIKILLDKAIKAAGGADQAARLKNVTWKGKGRIMWPTLQGKKQIPFQLKTSAQGWDRVRLQIDVDDWQESLTLIMNGGEKVWLNGWNVGPAAKAEFALRDIYYFGVRAQQMLPALLGKELQLAPVKEVKIKGQSAVGLRIARKDQPDVSLYFDKKTSLPIMTELRVPNAEGIDVVEVLYSDYREFNGLKHFSKMIVKIANKAVAAELMSMELSDIRPQKKLDASLFDMPEVPAERPQRRRAHVTVRVPTADAEVWFDDHRTQQTGTERTFESPPLEPGEYSYQIRAKWRQNGKDVDLTRTVDVQPGQRVIVDFNRAEKKKGVRPALGK
jgi:uncharacterized protein (TIGR03000 family)